MIRPEIARLQAYHPPPQEAAVKLNQNESPFDLPASVKRKVVKLMEERDWSRYPHATSASLVEAIARHTKWKRDGIIVGNGSNELIQWTMTTVVPTGAPVVIAAPTFSLYEKQVLFRGATPILIEAAGPDGFDVDAILAAERKHRPAATVLCSPNNPTGASLSRRALGDIAQAAAGLVIADEAYRDFCNQDYRPLLTRHANLLLLRTFSKAFAMAALRVGYLLAQPELVAEINKVRLPYNLNVMSALAAGELLERPAILETRVKKIVDARNVLLKGLDKIDGIRAYPSKANFVLCRMEQKPSVITKRLLEKGILIRDISAYRGLEDCIRITVGTRAEIKVLLSTLPEVI